MREYSKKTFKIKLKSTFGAIVEALGNIHSFGYIKKKFLKNNEQKESPIFLFFLR